MVGIVESYPVIIFRNIKEPVKNIILGRSVVYISLKNRNSVFVRKLMAFGSMTLILSICVYNIHHIVIDTELIITDTEGTYNALPSHVTYRIFNVK